MANITVKELKEFLDGLPDDAVVYRQGDEYNGDSRRVCHVEYIKEWRLDSPPNSVMIR